jgi:UDP-N-acetylglucosamine--N-acetylmuramyl-(pentapeptide) pyrophosphoryl-undecaprenol N-acetylglucosamine transferase
LPQALRQRLDVVHQVRQEQVATAEKIYDRADVNAEVSPFFSDMGQRLSAAHLVISRAGASSVTELQVAGRPAIIVPFAAAADDHQTANAEGLTSVGAADVFTEQEFEPAALAACLERRFSDPHGLAVRAAAARSAAKPEAAKSLADLAESVAR